MGSWVPLAKTVLAEVVNEVCGQLVETGFHWLTNAVVDSSFLSGLAAVFDLWNYNNLQVHLSSKCASNKVVCTDMSSQSGPSYILPDTAHIGAVTETTGLPSGCALAVKSATAKRGRSYRGRNYLMGVPATYLVSGDADTVGASHIADYVSDFGDLVSALDTYDSTGYLVVASKYANGAPRVTGVLTPITSFSINDQMDSQRRRLRGRGT